MRTATRETELWEPHANRRRSERVVSDRREPSRVVAGRSIEHVSEVNLKSIERLSNIYRSTKYFGGDNMQK